MAQLCPEHLQLLEIYRPAAADATLEPEQRQSAQERVDQIEAYLTWDQEAYDKEVEKLRRFQRKMNSGF
jgi:outer membrane cobalamin receptor